jgi:hypothetical protein
VTAQTLVYVHGAGAQRPARELKQELDQLLFGHELALSRVAYYSDIRWPPPGAFAGRAGGGPAGASRKVREGAVHLAEHPKISPKAAAAAIVTASLAPRARGDMAAAGSIGGRTQPPESAPTHDAEAARLVEQLYRRADRISKRSSTGTRPLTAGVSFPDPIFRRVVGFFASDVIDYLYGGFKEQMRARVRQALLNGPAPRVIVAHSLGTIVLYDVLSDPAFAGLDVQLLVTVGCPLGIGNVQGRLRDGAGRPNPVPHAVKAWANFADRWDPVALDPTLRTEFSPPDNFAKDESVNNPAKNNHDLTGYLSVGLVRSSIVTAVGA